ncbi:hypothetical protein CN074_28855 [Sinorhizobium medicae]|uniref:hypothetical protein n=1 Tax=Sinorhizobium medicae TaxID=110321 RepID=UPI000FD9DAFB|nr:hypothetical protein [Sinorhizobium medicae]RVH92234.1 hypothetical protein CN201_11625 [Sinorhizobium medicae]RVP61606.1 hypothetical protein CN074_28855 [Sinorhizobium medicae]
MWLKITVALAAISICSPAASQEICAQLLQQGVRDVSTTDTTEARFALLKASMCTTQYDTLDKARSASASGGLDVVGVFGISGSGSDASSEYSSRYNDYCSSNYSNASSDSTLRTYTATANQKLLDSFDKCVANTSERFIRYVEPQPDGRSFNVVFLNKIGAASGFTVSALTILDTTESNFLAAEDVCQSGTQKISFPLRDSFNTVILSCKKVADHQYVVHGISDRGPILPIVIPAVPKPTIGLEERVAALDSRISELKTLEEQLSNKLTDSVAQLGSKIQSESDANLAKWDVQSTKEANEYMFGTWASGQINQARPFGDDGSRYNGKGVNFCPAGSYVSGLQGFVNNGAATDSSEIRFWCRSIK